MKKTIKLNENTLRQIVAECMKKALKEFRMDDFDYHALASDRSPAAQAMVKNYQNTQMAKAPRNQKQPQNPQPQNTQPQNPQTINENTLSQIVAESIKKVLREDYAGTDWFDENPNKGVFSEEFEMALNNAHKALGVLLNAVVKESSQVQDINAKKDIERIREGVNTCLIRLDSYVPGVRTC